MLAIDVRKKQPNIIKTAIAAIDKSKFVLRNSF